MSADHEFRARRSSSDFIDAQSRSVAGKDCARSAHAVELLENFFFEGHALENGFDHQVCIGEVIVSKSRCDVLQALFGNLLGETATLHRIRVIQLDGSWPTVEGCLVRFFEKHGNA